ncbi:hypothetical protein NX059_010056 [Plenodomus lindquistii]|nr:hypothetical protein NX059_010056 [Plenodomus lindquistii]
MRSLRDMLNFSQKNFHPENMHAFTAPAAVVGTLGQQQFPNLSGPLWLQHLTDIEVEERNVQAWKGVLGMLAYHDEVYDRAHDTRMFMSAIEKAMAGQENRWSAKEKLYMTLTDPALPSYMDRLKSASILVVNLDLVAFLHDVCESAAKLSNRVLVAKNMDKDLQQTRRTIAEKVDIMIVDRFACAVPLSSLQSSATPSVVDDNAGACPICQHSFTDLTNFKAQDLIADYPVRIKYCGHVVGKSCLETWMDTPNADPAKYPDRACPVCRAKIEGVQEPPIPKALPTHLRSDRRGMETVRDLIHNYGLERDECHEAVVACISRSIACTELLGELQRQKSNGDANLEENEKILVKMQEETVKEMRAWGFRGASPWKEISAKWMNSGVVLARRK